MSQQLLEAYDTLFKSLCSRISAMLGRITTHSLMERALFETSRESALIDRVVLLDDGIDLSQLRQQADEIDMEELRNTMNSLVVNFVGVLAEQVGQCIADQIAQKSPLSEESEG